MVLYPNKLPESERVCSGICMKIPQIIDFTDKDGNDTMQQQIDANYYRIKSEVRQIVADEIGRIKADPELSHLIKDK